jgi:hypothetical protein
MMDKEKPHWTALVKAGAARQGVFTEEMRQAVLTRIDQDRKKRFNHSLIYVAIPLLGLLLCLFLLPHLSSEQAAGLSLRTTSQVDRPITLHYEPANNLAVIPESDKAIRSAALQLVPVSSVHMNNAVTIHNLIKYVDYTKLGDDTTSYFGFALASQLNSVNPQLYEIGYGKMSDVQVQGSEAFGLSNLRADGQCGPERRCVYWLSIDQDKVTAYYQMDASTIYEPDLDGDGVTEAVVLTHAQDMYIYKNIDGEIQSVNVQTALKAEYGDIVTYDPEHREFQLTNGKDTKRYQYEAGADRLRQVHEEVQQDGQ